MSGKRVLFYSALPVYGGVDAVLIDLVRCWSGPESLIVAINASHPGRAIYAEKLKGKAELHFLGEPLLEESRRGPFQILRFLRLPFSVFRFLGFLSRVKPDALMLVSGGFPVSPPIWRMLLAARFYGLRRVELAVHGNPLENVAGLRRNYLRLMGHLTLALCDRVITVSRNCADSMAPYLGARGRAPEVVYNGSSQREETAAAQDKRAVLGGQGSPLIGAIGNLEEGKGFGPLISAMAAVSKEIPAARLVIIGAPFESGAKERLEEQIKALGLGQSVRLAGFLPDAGRYVECFDLCVIPSIAYESFGVVALEAMRYGKPLIATRVGGLPEVVGEAGVLVAPKDAAALAEAILGVLRSPEAARTLGEAGHKRFQEFFTAEKMSRRYRELLLGGLNGNGTKH